MFHFSWHVLWACKTLVLSVCLKKRYVSPLFAPVCHPPGDSDSESVTIAFWLHLPTQRYIGCHGFTKSLQTQMTQTHIPSFIHFFLMKTQEWKDCYVHRNIGIRGSNAKYETGMKELKVKWENDPVHSAARNTGYVSGGRRGLMVTSTSIVHAILMCLVRPQLVMPWTWS